MRKDKIDWEVMIMIPTVALYFVVMALAFPFVYVLNKFIDIIDPEAHMRTKQEMDDAAWEAFNTEVPSAKRK